MRLTISYFLTLLLVLFCSNAYVNAMPQGPCGPPPSGPPPSGPRPSGRPPGGGPCGSPPSTTAATG
ncbi:proline, histidine and glycine-rich protein 1 [Drosophila grimshawi]|uniref:GH12840 n=1 Tax=Drosophila grimshawi TaxID=7222 RepID=B4JLD8_DROGR|nr:proline, histidine and glycine-rich protein 1 [Drosophila grimshawi]EDW00391.1 GH12840 [Drosophila grimshawi]